MYFCADFVRFQICYTASFAQSISLGARSTRFSKWRPNFRSCEETTVAGLELDMPSEEEKRAGKQWQEMEKPSEVMKLLFLLYQWYYATQGYSCLCLEHASSSHAFVCGYVSAP